MVELTRKKYIENIIVQMPNDWIIKALGWKEYCKSTGAIEIPKSEVDFDAEDIFERKGKYYKVTKNVTFCL